ncbi:MAG: phosphate ABC transporter permease subunit PstC [Planctomyces sp.]|nr:phosphate ABC transporter permease subunit PstC [Planctomyces sp.]
MSTARPSMFQRSRSANPKEQLIHVLLLCCALVSILTTLGIVVVLLRSAVYNPGPKTAFFEEVSLGEFLTDTRWKPVERSQLSPEADQGHFGIWPLLSGTLMVAVIASLVSVPTGLGAAIYMSEYAGPRERSFLKPVLEILAGIPTVVYGFFALHFITPMILQPVLKHVFGIEIGLFNVASAGIVVGIMVTPMIASLSEDVLRSVPRSLREAGYALGSTRFDVSMRVVVPAALSGILAAFLLAFSRAIGETMAVTIAGGHKVLFSVNPFEEMRTMTGYMVHQSFGDNSADSIQNKSIYAIGLALFVITLSINIASQWILRKFREVYQ